MVAIFVTDAKGDVIFKVENNFPYDRKSENITFGVPFSEAEGIYTVSKFGLFKDGVELDAQFKVTARWGGHPTDETKKIKWVLVDSKIDNIKPYSNESLKLVTEGGKGTASSGIVINENSNSVTVNTGAADFVISKVKFNLFDQVKIGNINVISSGFSEGGKIVDVSSGLKSIVGGNSFVENQGIYKSNDAIIDSVAVEGQESGPVHSIITVRGHQKTSKMDNHIEWTARFHFYKNSSDVLCQYIFTDRYLPGYLDRYDIDYIGLNVRIDGMENPMVKIAGDISTTNVFSSFINSSEYLSLHQTGKIEQSLTDYNPGDISTIKYNVDGKLSATGGRSRGWADIFQSQRGVLVAVRNFWEMYPGKIKIDGNGNVDIVLWPSENDDMTLYSGAQRSHDVLYCFHVAELSNPELELKVSQFQNPLMPLADPVYYTNSLAFGYVGTLARNDYPPKYQDLISNLATKANNAADFINSSRNDTWGDHCYGKWAFGDGGPADGFWASNDYDLLRSYILGGLMSNDYSYRIKWLTIAKNMSRHISDVQIKHSYTANRNDIASNLTPIDRNGGTIDKKYLGRAAYNPTEPFHEMGTPSRVQVNVAHQSGAQGLAYFYFLTGDILAKETALSQRYYLRTFRQLWDAGGPESRSYGQFIAAWAGIYSLTSNAEDYDDLNYWYNYANKQQDAVSAYDPNGDIWTGSSNYTVSFMNSLMFIALLDLHAIFPEMQREIEQRIIKACDFTQDPSKHLWDDTNKWFWRDVNTTTYPGYRFSSSVGFSFASQKAKDKSKRFIFLSIAEESLYEGILKESISKEKDVSSFMRGLFQSLYFLPKAPVYKM